MNLHRITAACIVTGLFALMATGCTKTKSTPSIPPAAGPELIQEPLNQHFESLATLVTADAARVNDQPDRITSLKKTTPAGYVTALQEYGAATKRDGRQYAAADTAVEIKSIQGVSNTRIVADVREVTYLLHNGGKTAEGYTCKHRVLLDQNTNGAWKVTSNEMVEYTGLLPRPMALKFSTLHDDR